VLTTTETVTLQRVPQKAGLKHTATVITDDELFLHGCVKAYPINKSTARYKLCYLLIYIC